MNIFIVLFCLMFASGAYFVAKGLFGPAGLCGVTATAAIAVVILQNGNTLTNIGLKTAGVEGMSLALLKLSGDSVHDYATISDDSPSPSCASRARSAATS